MERLSKHRWGGVESRILRITGILLGFLLAFFPTTLRADFIYLKNGTVIEGYFLSQEGDEMIFKDMDEREVRIPERQIRRLEVGYSGIPVCYRERGESTDDCDILLHSVNSQYAVFVPSSRAGSLKPRRVRMEDVEHIEVKKRSRRERIIPILSEGIWVELRLDDGVIRGEVREIMGSSILVDPGDGTSQKVYENQMKEVQLFIPYVPPVWRRFDYWKLVPGVYQYRQGRYLMGSSILLSMVALGAGIQVEYGNANKMDNRADSDYLNFHYLYRYGGIGTYVVTSDYLYLRSVYDSYESSFNRHKQNQRALGGGIFLVYLLHLWDAKIFTLEEVPGEHVIRQPRITIQNRISTLENRIDHYQGIGFQFSF